MDQAQPDVDVITFRGPYTRTCRLFVTGFSQRVSKAALVQLFSQYGLVNHIFIKPGEDISGSSILATVYFYSRFEAERAAAALDKAVVFRHQIRVKLYDGSRSRTKGNNDAHGNGEWKEERLMKMSLTRCFHVLSHFFGFDGWSSQLLKIKSIEMKNKRGELVLRRKVSALINVQEMPMRVLENTQGVVRQMPYDKCLKTAVSEARLDALRKLEIHVCRSTGRARAYCTV